MDDEMSLQPHVLIKPFEKWNMDVVGHIDLMSHGKRCILECIDYVTKWVEEKYLTRETKKVVANFLFEYIFIRFGIPIEIVTYQGEQFTSIIVRGIIEK
jgi:hypothetical protein